ncbi:hypothetical protein K438DRAFT_1852044 [Mycena galopus ATCC 62051]|nr:hypothetical protein K438DRAFT_1852044 [Mycena galopus ATCC 62051]
MIFTTLISFFAALLTVASSPLEPLEPHQLDVIAPPILSPNETASWTSGKKEQVVWDTSAIPPAFANNKAEIMLGYITYYNDTNGQMRTNENLNYTHPLASNFTIGAGRQEVVVPAGTMPGNNYIVVLLGDSGNCSPKFEIKN